MFLAFLFCTDGVTLSNPYWEQINLVCYGVQLYPIAGSVKPCFGTFVVTRRLYT